MNPPNIAIDGPASSGKGSVAKEIARRLGYTYVDTGSIYRTVALWALEGPCALDDGPGIARGIPTLNLRFDATPEAYRVWMGEREVTQTIREARVGDAASVVSSHPEVRAALLRLQRKMARSGGVVMDGRDIGTVVLPEARFKVYLEASLEERARRRFLEEQAWAPSVSFEEVRDGLAARDRRDMERAVSPLIPAHDAWVIDSTALTIEEVVERISSRVFSEIEREPPNRL